MGILHRRSAASTMCILRAVVTSIWWIGRDAAPRNTSGFLPPSVLRTSSFWTLSPQQLPCLVLTPRGAHWEKGVLLGFCGGVLESGCVDVLSPTFSAGCGRQQPPGVPRWSSSPSRSKGECFLHPPILYCGFKESFCPLKGSTMQQTDNITYCS